MRKIPIIILSFFILSSCAESGTLVRSRSNYYNNILGQEILILPAKTKVEIVDIAGKKYIKTADEDYLHNILQPILVEELARHSINSKIITQSEIDSLDLREDYCSLQDKNSEIISHLYFSKKLNPHKAFNIDANFDMDLKNFTAKTDCNILIMLEYHKIIQTNGARMRNFLLSLINGLDGGSTTAEAGDLSVISINIIDARTGDFLWSNLIIKENDPHKLMENKKLDLMMLEKLVRQSLQPMNSSERVMPSKKANIKNLPIKPFN